jgi:DNA invertase Pin-like site-specific DNA recombinase
MPAVLRKRLDRLDDRQVGQLLNDEVGARLNVLVERVKSGMRRARLEGRQIGRARLDVNREQVIEDRRSGMSLTQVAKKHGISRASVCRLMKEAVSNPPMLQNGSLAQAAHV